MKEAEKTPVLGLIFEKGPRKGETVACSHGSTVRIGRIIRGNTFTIKDPAISQKHLLIESDGHKWSVSDLDTSNGTLINDIKLQPNSPFYLSDGDSIKIGSDTSIKVRIQQATVTEVAMPPQRNTRRRAAARDRVLKNNEADISESKPGLERTVVDGDGKCRDEAGVGDDVGSIAVKMEENVGLEIDPPRRNPRRRAAAGVRSSRRLRSSENVDEGSVNEVVGAGGEIKATKANVGEKAETELPPPMPPNSRCRAAAGKTKVACKEKSPSVELNVALERCRESEEADEAAAVDENSLCGEDVRVEERRKDLENITLGEWFDRMEKYLPRKTNEAAEEIISRLRQRQKQFEEFIGERLENGKGKLPVSY